MYQIICDYCGEKIKFPELNQKTISCSNCNSSLEHLAVQEISAQQDSIDKKEESHGNGLILIYQKTGQQISISNFEKVILGRENFGSEVLGKIPQISRAHCCIELRDNQYIINDLGSMHGTYIGINKTDCKINPNQNINDNDLIFLGREPFLVKFITPPASEQVKYEIKEEVQLDETKAKKIIKYRCKSCGTEFDEKLDICPKCGTYGEIEVIEK